MAPETNEIQQYLTRLIELTKTGKITWSQPNPTTYSWTREVGGGMGRVNLQRVSNVSVKTNTVGGKVLTKVINYSLEVLENLNVVLSIDTTSNAAYKPLLDDLYQTIKISIDQKGINFLKDLLDTQQGF